MKSMKWRKAARKLQFIRKTMRRDDEVLCKQAITNKYLLNLKGLGHEGEVLTRKAGLPDPRFNQTTKGAIKEAAREADLKEKKKEVEASRKVGDRMSDNKDLREYLKVLSLADARV